jgi:hypothetical protein
MIILRHFPKLLNFEPYWFQFSSKWVEFFKHFSEVAAKEWIRFSGVLKI